MQRRFDFLAHDLVRRQQQLQPLLMGLAPLPQRSPIAQLIKSMISGRTRDAVSLRAFERLSARYHTVGMLARAAPGEVAHIIADVTFPEDKASYLVSAIQRIRTQFAGFRLEPLGEMPVPQALASLERLPGVGRKVAASTLNASTLAMPVLIVDTHALRVLQRLELVGANADYRAASEAVTEAMTDIWDGRAFLQFHMVIKRLGQLCCHHGLPDCGPCPLRADCPSAHHFGMTDRQNQALTPRINDQPPASSPAARAKRRVSPKRRSHSTPA
jgi:endonuclease-3